MKRSTRIVKRTLALFLVVLMSIESFGAVVSDNDGSAFITKAEFDSLKNDFQSQIDQYNTSIDAKIDGAIASYLGGINLSNVDTVQLPLAGWGEITEIKSVEKNTYKMLDFDAGFIKWSRAPHTAFTSGGWTQTWVVFSKNNYTRAATDYQRRLLCDAGAEGDIAPASIVWLGISKDYREKLSPLLITHQNGINMNNGGYMGGYDLDASYMELNNATHIEEGYWADLSVAQLAVWNPRFYWYDGYRAEGKYRADGVVDASTIGHNIYLGVVDGKTIDKEHILTYDNEYLDYFSDTDWSNTLRRCDSNTITEENLKTAVTMSGMWYIMRVANGTGETVASNNDFTSINSFTRINSGNRATSTAILPSLGVVNKKYTAGEVMQTNSNDVFKTMVDKVEFKTSQLNLYQGFPVLAAKAGDIIEWTPIFKNTKKNGSASNFDLNVIFATSPFDSSNNVADSDKIILDGLTTNYATTSGGRVKVKFQMPKDGIVYCKWNPSDTTTLSATSWEATLDLLNCATYNRTKSN